MSTDKTFKGFVYRSGYSNGFSISGPDPRCADMIKEANIIVGEGGYANLLTMDERRLENFIEELHYMRSLIQRSLVTFRQNRKPFESQLNGFYMEKEKPTQDQQTRGGV